jgi:hypothetical protein
MTEIAKGGGADELSRDINVITAEINSYKQIAGQSIFEIGKRLKHVKENDLVHGEFINWCEMTAGIPYRQANRFMKVFEEIDATKMTLASQLGLDVLYEIASMKPNERDKPHTIPSTGETKHVDEMTRKELREVKKALKEAEAQRELALSDAQILRDTLESIENKEPEVEIRTEYVEVTDESSEKKLRKYEEMFGDISIYEHGPRRVSNRTEIMSSIQMFSHDTRNLLKKYAYFEQYSREICEMPDGVKKEFKSALEAINNFVVDMAEVIGVNSGNIIDAEIIEN